MLRKKKLENLKINLDDLYMYCLQCWFIRSSFKEKIKLLKEFVSNTDSDILQALLNMLTPEYIKSIYYSNSQTEENFVLDAVQQDSNRMLSMSSLHSAQEQTVIWYKSLNSKLHLTIFLTLIKLGSPSLTLQLVQYIKITLCKRWKTFLSQQQPIVTEYTSESVVEDIPILEEASSLKKKKKKKSRASSGETKIKTKLHRETKITTTEGKVSIKNDSNDLFSKEAVEFLEILKRLISEMKSEYKEENEVPQKKEKKANKTKSKKEPDVVDQIQLLPVWVNQMIMKHLDSKYLTTLKNVNSYWSKIVDNLKKEQSTRANINKTLAKILKDKSSIKEEARKKKGKKSAKSSKSTKIPKSVKKTKSIKSTPRTVDEELDNPPSAIGLPTTNGIIRTQIFSSIVFPRYIISTRFSGYSAISVDPSGRLLAVSEGNIIKLHSLSTGSEIKMTFQEHTARVTTVEFHPGGDLLSASNDKTIKRWSMCSHIPCLVYQGHTEPIIAISVTQHYVATVAQNSVIKVFNVDGGYCVWTMQWMLNTPTALQMSDNGALYIGNEQGHMAAYNIWKPIPPVNTIAHKGRLSCMLFDGTYLFSGGHDGYVRLWSASNIEKPLAVMDHNRKLVTCMCLYETALISGCPEGSLYVWNIKTAEHVRTVNTKFSELRSIKTFRYADHVKIILNFDCQIQVLEFPTDELQIRKKVFPIFEGGQNYMRAKKIKAIITHSCSNAILRSKRNRYVTTDPLMLEIIKQNDLLAKHLTMFPRYLSGNIRKPTFNITF